MQGLCILKTLVLIEMEFRVEFVDGLLEVGAVYAVVGADCRRDVFVTEQHLDDFRVFARLEQHTRISVPQGMEVELVRRQSVLTHKALEYRLRTGVCPQIVVDDGSVTAVEFFAQCGGHLHCDFGARPAVKDFAHAFSVAVVSERHYGTPPSVVPLIDGTLVFPATDDLFLFRFRF